MGGEISRNQTLSSSKFGPHIELNDTSLSLHEKPAHEKWFLLAPLGLPLKWSISFQLCFHSAGLPVKFI